jgi:hypothetical protein
VEDERRKKGIIITMSQQLQLQPLASGASSGSLANGTTVPPLPASSVSSPFLGQSVIPLVNKLQDIFSQLGSASTIDLPQVLRSPFFVSVRYTSEKEVAWAACTERLEACFFRRCHSFLLQTDKIFGRHSESLYMFI